MVLAGSSSVITVSRQIPSHAFKRRLTFSFTVIIFKLKQLSTTVKSFDTKAALEYKAILKFKAICMCCYAFLSDESLFT